MPDANILPLQASFSAAAAIAQMAADARFVGFSVIDDGKPFPRKQPHSKSRLGVGADTPTEDTFSVGELLSNTQPPGGYWGISMHKPITQMGYTLVCIDLDAKRSNAPQDIRMQRLIQAAKQQGLLYERSLSLKGAHIWAFAKTDPSLPAKIDLGHGQEIEIFGNHPASPKASVLLSGIELSGSLKAIDSLRDFLQAADIDPDFIPEDPQHAAPTPSAFTKTAPERVKDMLSYMRSDIHHNDWVRICMAAKSAGGTYQDIREWSEQADSFDAKVFDAKWKSWKDKPGGVGLGTLKYVARSAGWEEPPEFIQTDKDDTPQHPLAIEVSITSELQPPRMVIPGFIGEGITSFAGQHGIGKTTGILPLSFIAAGLIQNELTPRHWRHVVYITEDTEQAKRIISGLAQSLNIPYTTITERFHLVEAVRMHASQVVQVADTYKDRYIRFAPHDLNDSQVELRPLVIFDTKSAIFSMENENDAAEAAEMMAAIKQRFNKFPCWLITHIAKASFGKSDALTARGSTAIEADAHQNAYIVAEGDHRFIVLGKRRFEAKWTEIELASEVIDTMGIDEFGQVQTIALRWAIPQPPTMTRQEAANAAKDESREERDTDRRTAILEAVEDAWMAGNPISKGRVKEVIKGKASDITSTAATLITEGWLYEVEVPIAQRLNPNKKSFLVRLTDAERREYIANGVLPDAKVAIPPTWTNTPKPSVPDTLDVCLNNEQIEW